ncbi:hypothetical protein DACRYDRAFT_106545 [Dacryopinax primogenitus]|uniref:Uncharacterized protein n=1 Tax=Dacryopinax primogenitus (strain DJM 731) TaxID=1858805 RepID=M5FZB4_DACPD|nr:uncharacterized protein DACRYDRAFT_106545 [Dacryopinax primogenitus]EJU03386.1 hypothetical protein DACRYDRAFT_106545 [Dacryopinax primogenitus]
MASKRTMPTGRESPSAPHFSPTPLSVTCYFAALEKLFGLFEPAVTAGADKIDWARFYTDDNTYKLWVQIHDGMETAKKDSYEDSKAEILKYYPGAANNEHWYTTRDLDDLVHKWQHTLPDILQQTSAEILQTVKDVLSHTAEPNPK